MDSPPGNSSTSKAKRGIRSLLRRISSNEAEAPNPDSTTKINTDTPPTIPQSEHEMDGSAEDWSRDTLAVTGNPSPGESTAEDHQHTSASMAETGVKEEIKPNVTESDLAVGEKPQQRPEKAGSLENVDVQDHEENAASSSVDADASDKSPTRSDQALQMTATSGPLEDCPHF